MSTSAIQLMTDEQLFAVALLIERTAERAQFLEQVCRDRPDQRQRVQELLQANQDAGSFLNHPVVELPPGTPAERATPGGENVVNESPSIQFSAIAPGFLTPSQRPNSLGRLGAYEIEEVIGRGGMGVVFRALDTKLNRVVAIKALAPELIQHPASGKQFLREAQAAAAVSHDHVVTIHAVDETAEVPYLVMECVVGQSLQQRIDRRGTLTLKEILRIGMQVAQGLAAAHKQGLVHRDIKPANILLENGIERVKITDFGLARMNDDIGSSPNRSISGTPQYMSPEQARGESIDHRSDLFSLGSVLYTMCTDRPAFRAGDPLAILARVVDSQPQSVREINPEIPEWLELMIFRLLAKKAEDRFQSASEVAEVLSQRLTELQEPSTGIRSLSAPTSDGKLQPTTQAIVTPPVWISSALLSCIGGQYLLHQYGILYGSDLVHAHQLLLTITTVCVVSIIVIALVQWLIRRSWKQTLFGPRPALGMIALSLLAATIPVSVMLLISWRQVEAGPRSTETAVLTGRLVVQNESQYLKVRVDRIGTGFPGIWLAPLPGTDRSEQELVPGAYRITVFEDDREVYATEARIGEREIARVTIPRLLRNSPPQSDVKTLPTAINRDNPAPKDAQPQDAQPKDAQPKEVPAKETQPSEIQELPKPLLDEAKQSEPAQQKE